jgi:hypothetical protein
MRRVTLEVAGATALALAPAGQAQSPVDARTLWADVSIAEIERTLHAIDVDRTAGSDGARAAAAIWIKRSPSTGLHTQLMKPGCF